MIQIIKLAFRNILRNKRRSALAATSIALALIVLVFFQSLMGGYMGSMTRNSTKNDTGHVSIYTKKYHEKQRFMPIRENVQEPEKIISAIKNNEEIMKYVDIITKRTRFSVLMENEGKNKTALVFAGNIEKEKKLLMLQDSIKDGKYIEGKRDAVIGAGLAESLNLGVGDKLKVMSETVFYSPNMRKFNITGIYKTGLKQLDESVVQITLDDADALLKTGGSVQQIMIMLNDYRKADKVAKLIEEELAGLTDSAKYAVDPWTQAGGVAEFVKLTEVSFYFIYFIISLLGAFIINNIMTMVVLERKREIGILKALGMEEGEINLLFLLEGSLLGFFGSLAGIVLGLLVNIPLMTEGFDMSMYAEQTNYPMDRIIKGVIDPTQLFIIFAVGVSVSAIVSIAPSRKAAKMNAVRAIRDV